MKIALVLACIALALGTTTVKAAPDAKGNYNVLGAGNASCGTWTQDRAANNAFDDTEWLLGFVTSFNEWGAGTANASEGIDNNGVIAWVDNYCLTHPLDTIGEASSMLIFALYLHQSAPQDSK